MSKKSKARANVKLVPQTEAPNVQAELAAQVEAAPTETATPVVAAPEAKKAKARYVSGRFAPNMVITKLVTGNPKQMRGAAYARFALHTETPQTVAEYVAASEAKGNKASLAHDDLRWDAAHGFIKVEAPATAETAKAE